MGFLHVGQAGLKLLTSSDPPVSASQSAAINYRCEPLRLTKFSFLILDDILFFFEMESHTVIQAGV